MISSTPLAPAAVEKDKPDTSNRIAHKMTLVATQRQDRRPGGQTEERTWR
jgi:hypothetical protein